MRCGNRSMRVGCSRVPGAPAARRCVFGSPPCGEVMLTQSGMTHHPGSDSAEGCTHASAGNPRVTVPVELTSSRDVITPMAVHSATADLTRACDATETRRPDEELVPGSIRSRRRDARATASSHAGVQSVLTTCGVDSTHARRPADRRERDVWRSERRRGTVPARAYGRTPVTATITPARRRGPG